MVGLFPFFDTFVVLSLSGVVGIGALGLSFEQRMRTWMHNQPARGPQRQVASFLLVFFPVPRGGDTVL
jgi:hypothetical protein